MEGDDTVDQGAITDLCRGYEQSHDVQGRKSAVYPHIDSEPLRRPTVDVRPRDPAGGVGGAFQDLIQRFDSFGKSPKVVSEVDGLYRGDSRGISHIVTCPFDPFLGTLMAVSESDRLFRVDRDNENEGT